MKIQPTQNYLLCSIHELKESMIALPDGAEVQPYAIVIAAGPECSRVAVGDKILFNPQNAVYADQVDGEKLIIISEGCVFAKYMEDPTDV